jgi:hypothetical protein
MLPDAVIDHVAPRHKTESALLRNDGSGGAAAIRFKEHHETSLEPPVALFLPKSVCEMNRRRVLTEFGPDTDAQRAEDWEGVLFDPGLDA